jgi:hypothetical protein
MYILYTKRMLRFENFNLNRIKDMSHNDAKAYIDKYFFVLSDGACGNSRFFSDFYRNSRLWIVIMISKKLNVIFR